MKIAVIGAAGKDGGKILQEAQQRGHEVLAIVRDRKKITDTSIPVLEKSLFALTLEDLVGCDALVDAFGAWGDRVDEHITSLAHLTKILKGSSVHLYVVGGAGSLYTTSSHTTQLKDSADFPAAFKPLAEAMAEALAELRFVQDVQWTYVSPAAAFEADGPATGDYVLAGEEWTTNEAHESAISYADYATGFVAIIESQQYNQQRVSLRW